MSHYSGPPLNVVSLNQVEKDTVMVGYDHIHVLCVLMIRYHIWQYRLKLSFSKVDALIFNTT